jgi:cytochrome c2
LWDVVERPIAAYEGYEYSDPMHAFAEQAQVWSYEHLSDFLADPNAVVPGTNMAFPGLTNATERANVIAYLRTLSESPKPLPVATTASAAPEGAAAAPAPEPEAQAAEEQPAADDASAAAEAGSGDAPVPPEDAATSDAGTEPEAAGGEAPAEPEQTAQAEAAGEPTPEAAAPAAEPSGAASGFAAAVAAADAEAGAAYAKRCGACHTFDAGGETKVGPNLWNVVNRPIASVPDFEYSDAMVAFSENHTKVWDYDTLSLYLEDPKGVVPGTKMIFAGTKAEADRANLIAYLRTLADSPAPLE